METELYRAIFIDKTSSETLKNQSLREILFTIDQDPFDNSALALKGYPV